MRTLRIVTPICALVLSQVAPPSSLAQIGGVQIPGASSLIPDKAQLSRARSSNVRRRLQ